MKWTRAHGLGAALLVSLLVLLLALAAAALASQQAVQRLAASGDALQRSQQVLTTLATLQLAAADGTADTDPAALAQARAHADAQMATLRDLLSHDPAQYSRLVTVGPLLAQRFDAPAATEPRRRALAAGPVDQRAQQARLQPMVQTAVQTAVQALVGPAQQAFDANRRQHDEAAASARHWALWSGSAALLVVAALAAAGWKLLRLLDQQRAWAQAARQEQQCAASDLQHVLTASPAPLCVLDADGRFLRSNAACAALWGRDADALRGTPLLDGVAADDRRRTQLALDQLLAGAALAEFRHRVQRADGSTVLLAWQATWSAADRTLACAGHDITELDALRQQAAQQTLALQQGQQALAVARAQADEADALKTLFLSMLGQTLRAPLDHVDSMADVLLQGLSGPLAPAQQRELQQLRASAQQVRATVLDMLDLARIEAGAVQLRHEPFDMAEAIHKVAAGARQQAQDKGVQLHVQLADDLGYARGDERRFEQALGKLLDNAVRFTSAGSITLRATAEPAAQLQISITDTGIGIAADDMARLYQPFRPLGTSGAEARAKTTGPGETRGHQGVGLGLAIAQRLAVLMGGSIHASSQPQQGSTFTLRLPADTAATSAASPTTATLARG